MSWTWTAITKGNCSFASQQLLYRSVFLPTAINCTACLLRLLLYRNRQLGYLESTLEQYLEQLAGLSGHNFYQKRKEKKKENYLKCTKIIC